MLSSQQLVNQGGGRGWGRGRGWGKGRGEGRGRGRGRGGGHSTEQMINMYVLAALLNN
jgi:hypothetical protein